MGLARKENVVKEELKLRRLKKNSKDLGEIIKSMYEEKITVDKA